MAIFNLGSINMDYFYRLPHLVSAGETLAAVGYDIFLGGKGANQSVALAKAGADVFHIGAFGKRDEHYLKEMRENEHKKRRPSLTFLFVLYFILCLLTHLVL